MPAITSARLRRLRLGLGARGGSGRSRSSLKVRRA
jgi:hypothetical protein